jgi:RimJ/RimL family protein N-acetyltransferase
MIALIRGGRMSPCCAVEMVSTRGDNRVIIGLKEKTYTMTIHTRQLTADDVQAYIPVRLRALREHPQAFGSTYIQEREKPESEMSERLRDGIIYGAFSEGQLVGLAGLVVNSSYNTRHRAFLISVYSAAEVRGQGVGRAVVQAAIAHARAIEYVEEVFLTVTMGNPSARALYLSLGFVPYAIEPRSIKIAGQYYDEELMTLRFAPENNDGGASLGG